MNLVEGVRGFESLIALRGVITLRVIYRGAAEIEDLEFVIENLEMGNWVIRQLSHGDFGFSCDGDAEDVV